MGKLLTMSKVAERLGIKKDGIRALKALKEMKCPVIDVLGVIKCDEDDLNKKINENKYSLGN